jgi:hypothetical protein
MATRQRETSAEWAATIPEDITAEKAKERLQYAYDYSSDAINAVMSMFHGTVPPARELMPDLFETRRGVEAALSTIGALADRTPQVKVAARYVDLGRQLGARLIDESNAAMDRSKQSESPGEIATKVVQSAEHVALNAAKGMIKLGGVLLTPMEALFGAVLIDEIFNDGKVRRSLIGEGKRRKA